METNVINNLKRYLRVASPLEDFKSNRELTLLVFSPENISLLALDEYLNLTDKYTIDPMTAHVIRTRMTVYIKGAAIRYLDESDIPEEIKKYLDAVKGDGNGTASTLPGIRPLPFFTPLKKDLPQT